MALFGARVDVRIGQAVTDVATDSGRRLLGEVDNVGETSAFPLESLSSKDGFVESMEQSCLQYHESIGNCSVLWSSYLLHGGVSACLSGAHFALSKLPKFEQISHLAPPARNSPHFLRTYAAYTGLGHSSSSLLHRDCHSISESFLKPKDTVFQPMVAVSLARSRTFVFTSDITRSSAAGRGLVKIKYSNIPLSILKFCLLLTEDKLAPKLKVLDKTGGI
ncbi:predicted protein [Histoplasma capsulatum var. duboisii H88]|uniref:Predicted protein n=1 Tax=Ajellomyces capsulatus (strain H88) TaxID=544711 RepID=F0UI21_AJEC8|nr:predicted protein [Histoplasma capsulatum var. duboisii H88]